jgi:hypothetical protein
VITFGAVISGISILIKSVLLISLAIKDNLNYNNDDILMYKLVGVYLEKNKPTLGHMELFMTLYFDFSSVLLCVLLSLLY